MLEVLVPRERRPGETRVAATPDTVKRLVKEGLKVTVESGAGMGAYLRDALYADAGATLVEDAAAAFARADVVVKVAPPTVEEAQRLKEGAWLIGFAAPHKNADVVRTLTGRKVSSLAMELVPRITRAQKMDALSSQANIAGYKAVLLAASHLPTYFPLLMTAAGTVQPAKVVILGAGVAGLQAIATAKRLGAVVEVSDVRPAVKEQVESLGGRFIDLPLQAEGTGGYAKELSKEDLAKQQAIVAARIAASTVVITTALVPGKPAPRLIPRETALAMKPGSVIVDLAAEQGGNCELTKPGETVVVDGITVIGHTNLPATVPQDASALYARNVLEVLLLVTKKGEAAMDLEDEIVKGMMLTHAGEVRHAPTAELLRAGGA